MHACALPPHTLTLSQGSHDCDKLPAEYTERLEHYAPELKDTPGFEFFKEALRSVGVCGLGIGGWVGGGCMIWANRATDGGVNPFLLHSLSACDARAHATRVMDHDYS